MGTCADNADVVLEEVPVEELLASTSVPFVGWSGSPWAKEGWFEAHRLLAPALDGAHGRRWMAPMRA